MTELADTHKEDSLYVQTHTHTQTQAIPHQSKGIHASEMRVGAALQAVHPRYHETRRQVSMNINLSFVYYIDFKINLLGCSYALL